MIHRCKSCRRLTGKPVDPERLQKILLFEMKPPHLQIRVRMKPKSIPALPGYGHIGSVRI